MIKSTAMRLWLGSLFFEQNGAAPNAKSIQDAITVLEGMACYSGAEHEVFVRGGSNGSTNEIYVDLGTSDWSAIKITNEGWEIV